jgi:hypothetical protein
MLSATLPSSPSNPSSIQTSVASSPSRLPAFCFLVAGTTVIFGMCLGFYMGIAQDFTLAPVHAHLNLLGWVSLFLLGVYYRTHDHAIGRGAQIQVTSFVAGYLGMTIGMTGMFLQDHDSYLPLSIVGGVLLIASMLQFVVIVWRGRDE